MKSKHAVDYNFDSQIQSVFARDDALFFPEVHQDDRYITSWSNSRVAIPEL
jgi:hypothetical protein